MLDNEDDSLISLGSSIKIKKFLQSVFNNPQIIIKNKILFKEKIERFCSNGIESLQIIADFDHTISAFSSEKGKTPTSYQILTDSPYLPESLKIEDKLLRDKYFPIEHNTNLTAEEKTPLMIEWWNKANQLLFENNLTLDIITNTIMQTNITFRNGFREIFEFSNTHNIPLMIVSAGLGDVVKNVIEKEAGRYSNVDYTSNFFKFNDKGFIDSFQHEMIHSYNKHNYYPLQTEYIQRNQNRNNILLIGDMISDLNIVKNINEPFELLSIGFINEKFDDRLQSYSNSFDICINNPTDCLMVNQMLEMF